jgi:hypothetical protein
MTITSNIKKEQGINNLKEAGRNFQDAGESTASDLADRALNAGQEVRRYVSDAYDRASEIGSEVTDKIQHKPVQATVAALFAGIVLGLLMRR